MKNIEITQKNLNKVLAASTITGAVCWHLGYNVLGPIVFKALEKKREA